MEKIITWPSLFRFSHFLSLFPGLGSRSRSRSRFDKKSEAGAGATKKFAGSSVLREVKKQKEIVL